jgi:CO/xanthine dehydrogenase FAD-binding subunit
MEFDVVSPKTQDELLREIASNKNRNFCFGAGYTDLVLDLKIRKEKDLLVINLAQLDDNSFSGLVFSESGLKLGALSTVAVLMADNRIKNEYPVLYEAANSLASNQIRQVATVGGNLCTASPSGDLSCALVALKATCEIINSEGEVRLEPILTFFKNVKKTSLARDEMLKSIIVPGNSSSNIDSGFIKVGKRVSMECSIVSLAFHLQRDENNVIQGAGLALGAVAPTIQFAGSACEFLIGKSTLSESEKEEFANKILEYASPISDIRASDWYREEVLYNISKSFLDQR